MNPVRPDMIDLEMARTYRELMARAIHKINQRNEGADYERWPCKVDAPDAGPLPTQA